MAPSKIDTEPLTSLPFGTASAYANTFLTPPRNVQVTADTCFQLSLFKDLMREYRKLDDTIIIRLNRSNAARRDNNRISGLEPTSGTDATCLKLWREMMAGWQHRQQLLSYCYEVVGEKVMRDQAVVKGQDPRLSAKSSPVDTFEEEVLLNQYRNEQSVEQIIRKRSLEAFKSQCRFFQLPKDDPMEAAWWKAAEAAR